MTMHGYNIIRTFTNGDITVTYAVYTLDKGKHYRYGYKTYKDMIAAHPELATRNNK